MIKIGKFSYLHLHCNHLCRYYFLCISLISYFFFPKNFLQYFLFRGLLVTYSSGFVFCVCVSENIFFSSFLENIFCLVKNCRLKVLFCFNLVPQHFKMSFHCLLAYLTSDEKSSVLFIFFQLYVICIVSLGAFNITTLSFLGGWSAV